MTAVNLVRTHLGLHKHYEPETKVLVPFDATAMPGSYLAEVRDEALHRGYTWLTFSNKGVTFVYRPRRIAVPSAPLV